MTRRTPLPSHLNGSAFRVGDAGFHEASLGRLRASDLQRPFRGVRSLGLRLAETTDRCRAYEPLLRPGEAFSHETAAALFGLPVDEGGTLHVTSPARLERARSRGVIGHASSLHLPVVMHDGLPVVEPAYAWCQLGARLEMRELVALGDRMVTGTRRDGHRSPGLATPAELRSAVEAWGGRRGARRLAAALPRVRIGAESRPETLTRLLLVDADLPEPLLNHPTRVADGRILHPDFKYPEWRTLLEYQGDLHRTDRRRWQEDVRRKRAFETAGWNVVDVTSDDVFVDSASLLARVRASIPADR
jgi:hypothetical protein